MFKQCMYDAIDGIDFLDQETWYNNLSARVMVQVWYSVKLTQLNYWLLWTQNLQWNNWEKAVPYTKSAAIWNAHINHA